MTGEVGTGKTTLCRSLLEEIPADVETAFVLNPLLTVQELLATILDELGVEHPDNAGMKTLVDLLNEHLLKCHAAGKKCVLIIDEAQNLVSDVLEQLRLLTNLETNQRKLLQIILLGQPELLDLLKRNELRQFNQRITARYHLEALNFEETCEYILHRLSVAGGNASVFPRATLKRAYHISKGIPRVINLVCDRALLGTYAQGQYRVSPETLTQAAREVLGLPIQHRNLPVWLATAGVLLLSLIGGTAWLLARSADSFLPWLESSTPVIQELTSQGQVAQQADLTGHANLNHAYNDLFALWGRTFEDQLTPACDLAGDIGLGCYAISTNLKGLQNLDRPAIVQLDGNWLTLSQMTDAGVTLIAGNRQHEISQASFQQRWSGQAWLLWQLPPGWSGPVQLHDQGETVSWIKARLNVAGWQVMAPENNQFNEQLAEQVSSFQASVGLQASGIADVPTLIHLNSIDGSVIPRLLPAGLPAGLTGDASKREGSS